MSAITARQKQLGSNLKGIIFTGGPNSVYEEGSPHCEKEVLELGVPVLGICYGSQLMAYLLGKESIFQPPLHPQISITKLRSIFIPSCV